MKLSKNNTAALFIDYQEKLLPAQFEGELFLSNSLKLAKGLSVLGIPMVVSEQYPKGLGPTVTELSSLPGFPAGLAKITYSAQADEGIKAAIKATGAKQIILCGCETHICVLMTAMDLINEGYMVYVVSDCTASRTLSNHKVGIKRALQEGAFITSLETVLFELLGAAGTPEFKEISALIK